MSSKRYICQPYARIIIELSNIVICNDIYIDIYYFIYVCTNRCVHLRRKNLDGIHTDTHLHIWWCINMFKQYWNVEFTIFPYFLLIFVVCFCRFLFLLFFFFLFFYLLRWDEYRMCWIGIKGDRSVLKCIQTNNTDENRNIAMIFCKIDKNVTEITVPIHSVSQSVSHSDIQSFSHISICSRNRG